MNREKEERVRVDVHGYGMFLLELVTGKSALHFQQQGEGQTLIDWVTYLIQTNIDFSNAFQDQLPLTKHYILYTIGGSPFTVPYLVFGLFYS